MSRNHKRNRTDENLFNLLINKFLPFWPLILAFIIICMLVATVYISFSKSVYQTTASLLINDEEKGVEDSEMIESINVFKTKKIIENELEVITSKEIVKKVVDRLALYAPVYEKSRFRTIFAYETSPVRVSLKQPNLEANFVDDEDRDFNYDAKNKYVVLEGKKIPLGEWSKNPFGGSDIMFSPNPNFVVSSTDDSESSSFYFRVLNPRAVTQYIHESINAGVSSKLSTVVRLEYRDEIPKLGEDILNELIIAYKMSAVEDRDAIAQNTLDFIETRMKEVESQLETVEKELEEYRAKEGVIDLSKQGNLYLQNVGDYDRRLADINLQLSILQKVNSYVNSKGSKSGMVPSTMGVDDPILSQLLKDLYEAEIEYARLRKTTAANNPILVSLRNEIEKIRPSITEIISNQRSNLLISRDNLSSSSGKYNDALQVLPEQERKLIEITRRKESVSSLYDYLVQKREETALSYVPSSNDVRVIETPQSTLKPVSPKKSLIYFIAICGALAISMVVIGARELLSSKVLFRSELEKYTEIKVIGELAYVEKNDVGNTDAQAVNPKNILSRLNFIVFGHISNLLDKINAKKDSLNDAANEDIYVADQFRQILAYFGFYSRTRQVKKLMITSSIPGEGKSYVCANLARTLAISGKKVAILDMDLRNKKVSSLFDLSAVDGISDFLSERTSYASLLNKVDDTNLYVLPAGTKTAESSELLVNQNLDLLMETLDEEFDFILIDTPPFNSVSDAQTLNHFCDATIVLVRHAFTPKFVVSHLDENIRTKDLRNCVVVLNGVKNRGVVNYNYGYGYGYGVLKAEVKAPLEKSNINLLQ